MDRHAWQGQRFPAAYPWLYSCNKITATWIQISRQNWNPQILYEWFPTWLICNSCLISGFSKEMLPFIICNNQWRQEWKLVKSQISKNDKIQLCFSRSRSNKANAVIIYSEFWTANRILSKLWKLVQSQISKRIDCVMISFFFHFALGLD